jgi:glycosyltransferase involved in cell wall biosynthesis
LADGLHILVLGGTLDHPGGIEAFCERSMEALRQRTSGWRIARIPTDSAYLGPRKLFGYLGRLIAVVRYRRQRPDLVWLQYGNFFDLTYLVLARFLGLRVMVTPHLGSNWRSQKSGLLRAVSERLLRRAERLALISPTQELEIALPRHVPRSLIRNFLPAEILGADLREEQAKPPLLQLIHSGRLSKGKGSFLVVEICARLRDAGVPFEARITGGADPETRAQLDALVVERNLSDRLFVLGRVPEEELLDHLRGADVLVHPSRIDSYPLIVLEAIASGALPICLELAGARDMVETYGGQVIGTIDPVGEAAAWLAALDLRTLRTEGRAAAGRVRADYAWERCAGALEAALRACLAGDRTVVTQPEPVL